MVLLSLYFTFDELIGYVLSVYRAFIEWGDNVYLLITVLILFTAICVKPYMKVKKEEANQQRKKKKKQQNEEKMLSMMTLEERFKYINKKKDAANAKMYGEKAPKAPPKLPPIPKK